METIEEGYIQQCSICDLILTQDLVVSKQCGHVYHSKCAAASIADKQNCKQCNSKLQSVIQIVYEIEKAEPLDQEKQGEEEVLIGTTRSQQQKVTQYKNLLIKQYLLENRRQRCNNILPNYQQIEKMNNEVNELVSQNQQLARYNYLKHKEIQEITLKNEQMREQILQCQQIEKQLEQYEQIRQYSILDFTQLTEKLQEKTIQQKIDIYSSYLKVKFMETEELQQEYKKLKYRNKTLLKQNERLTQESNQLKQSQNSQNNNTKLDTSKIFEKSQIHNIQNKSKKIKKIVHQEVV